MPIDLNISSNSPEEEQDLAALRDRVAAETFNELMREGTDVNDLDGTVQGIIDTEAVQQAIVGNDGNDLQMFDSYDNIPEGIRDSFIRLDEAVRSCPVSSLRSQANEAMVDLLANQGGRNTHDLLSYIDYLYAAVTQTVPVTRPRRSGAQIEDHKQTLANRPDRRSKLHAPMGIEFAYHHPPLKKKKKKKDGLDEISDLLDDLIVSGGSGITSGSGMTGSGRVTTGNVPEHPNERIRRQLNENGHDLEYREGVDGTPGELHVVDSPAVYKIDCTGTWTVGSTYVLNDGSNTMDVVFLGYSRVDTRPMFRLPDTIDNFNLSDPGSITSDDGVVATASPPTSIRNGNVVEYDSIPSVDAHMESQDVPDDTAGVSEEFRENMRSIAAGVIERQQEEDDDERSRLLERARNELLAMRAQTDPAPSESEVIVHAETLRTRRERLQEITDGFGSTLAEQEQEQLFGSVIDAEDEEIPEQRECTCVGPDEGCDICAGVVPIARQPVSPVRRNEDTGQIEVAVTRRDPETGRTRRSYSRSYSRDGEEPWNLRTGDSRRRPREKKTSQYYTRKLDKLLTDAGLMDGYGARVYKDCGETVEVCTPIHKNFKSMMDWFSQCDKIARKHGYMPWRRTEGGGGMHINISFNKTVPNWKLAYTNFFVMVANHPQFNWIFNEPSDDHTANALVLDRRFIKAYNEAHTKHNMTLTDKIWRDLSVCGGKGYSINCKDEHHFEMRTFEMMRSPKEFYEVITLINELLGFCMEVASWGVMIPLDVEIPVPFVDDAEERGYWLPSDRDDSRLVFEGLMWSGEKKFNELVKNLGLDPKTYRKFIRRNYHARRAHPYGKKFFR